VRTEEEPSRIRGRSLGRRIAVGSGRGSLTGREESWLVRYERASLRWVSEREDDARDRWWANWLADDGAAVVSDCWFTTIAVCCQSLKKRSRETHLGNGHRSNEPNKRQ
jgi:hypothetical protein